MNKIIFTGKLNDKECKFEVRMANALEHKEAENIYTKTFAEAVTSGALIKKAADKILKDQGVWSDEQNTKFEELQKKVADYEYILTKKRNIKLGNHGKTGDGSAYDIAIKLMQARSELMNLLSLRGSIDSNTAEGKAENARMNYLVYCTSVYNDTGKRIFSSFEDFQNKSVLQDDNREWFDIASLCINKFFELNYMTNLTEKQNNLTEFKFLKKYGFVNDDLRLIDKAGNLIDSEGHKVNENGYRIDKNGNILDINGNPMDTEGNYLGEDGAFLDDDGNPLT